MDNELLKALSTLLDERLNPIKNDVNNIRSDINNMKSDINNIKTDINDMKLDIDNIKSDVDNLKSDAANMKTDIKYIKTQQEENYQILKSLEHSSEINKAEHDKFENDLALISGKIDSMRRDLSTVEIVTARNMENIAQLKIIK